MRGAKLIDTLRRIFQRRPPEIPDALWDEALASAPVFDHLDAEERARLRDLSARFLAEKEFGGAHALVLRDGMRVAIAAQACLLVLKLGLSAYRDWVGIVVYPDEFIVPRRIVDEDGIVHEFDDTVAGEAWEGGPVLISWQDATLADREYNVVIHEFAHKLDMRNGAVDGIPALHSGLAAADWAAVLDAAYTDFCRRLDRPARRGTAPELPLDPYAAEHPAEFFAVASECFFADPKRLFAAYPDFYALLARYYLQDPLAPRRAAAG
jgi:Mlc titration factor MtfA (ptsG expression regulator)